MFAKGENMKDLSLLVLVSQLGLSVALPLAGFLFLAIWLRDRFGLGSWVVLAGAILGLLVAIDGFIYVLKAMSRLSGDKKKDSPPPVSFNDHD